MLKRLRILLSVLVCCVITAGGIGNLRGGMADGLSESSGYPAKGAAKDYKDKLLNFLAPSSEKQDLVSEGVDTRCEIRFVPYEGAGRDLFLQEGDRIAVISPSALPTRKQVIAVVNGLRSWGYVPVEGKHVCDEVRTLEDCIEDLRWALEDPSVRGIFCVRGGYGASEVMDELPLQLIASSRKLIIGYSDITVFHSAWSSAGLPSVHCSMSAAFTDLPAANAETEKRLLRGEVPVYVCDNGKHYQEGTAEGILVGGNLSTFTSVLNTACDCTAKQVPYILFLEDEGENLQHIHRYMTILKHAGVLERASGIVFGEWVEMEPIAEGDFDGRSRGGVYESVADMLAREFTGELDIPVAFGFPAGHGEINQPLLMGAGTRLTVTKDRFRIEWPAEEAPASGE